MRIVVTALFSEESARYSLRHACEDCAHFDVERELCMHGYPTDEHRRATTERSDAAFVVFCKEWELA